MSNNDNIQNIFKAVLLTVPRGSIDLHLYVANMDTKPRHLLKINYREEFKDGTVQDGWFYFGTSLNSGEITKTRIDISEQTRVIKLQTAETHLVGEKNIETCPIRGEIARSFWRGVRLESN